MSHLRCPFLWSIWPISFPFHWSPRISELNDLFSIYLSNIKNRISMSKNNSILCNSFLTSTDVSPYWLCLCGSCHNLFFLICLDQFLPSLIFISGSMSDQNSRTSWKILNSLIWMPTINFLKRTISFSISLFKQYNPKFLFISSWKSCSIPWWIRNYMAVKLINFPFSINTQPNKKISTF